VQWSWFADQELANRFFFVPGAPMNRGWVATNTRGYINQIERFQGDLAKVESVLRRDGRRFLVGDELTLADLKMVGVLQFGRQVLMEEDWEPFPAVEAYFNSMMEVAEIAEAFGEGV
jgi:elongation factor 1-gamma